MAVIMEAPDLVAPENKWLLALWEEEKKKSASLEAALANLRAAAQGAADEIDRKEGVIRGEKSLRRDAEKDMERAISARVEVEERNERLWEENERLREENERLRRQQQQRG